jgi:pimeloyl-ACP methyl ester carboxylesterase
MLAPDQRHPCRSQAEIPLIDLSEFRRPPLNYYRADPIKVPLSIFDAAQFEAPDLALHFFTGVAEPPATTTLRVDVPTLVFWGMQDPALLPSQLDGLDNYAPHAVIVRIADGGHYPMRSHPALVNRVMREFIEHS